MCLAAGESKKKKKRSEERDSRVSSEPHLLLPDASCVQLSASRSLLSKPILFPFFLCTSSSSPLLLVVLV